MLHPRTLKPGDTVALLALSSPARDAAEVAAARALLEGMGFRVVAGRSLRGRCDYLAGSDALRASDLKSVTANRSVRGIFFLRGGYGSARLLPLVDWRAIARRRLLIAGFSDLTSVLAALDRARLATLHVPTMSFFLSKGRTGGTPVLPSSDIAAFDRLLFDSTPLGSMQELTGGFKAEVLRTASRVTGLLLGGNLSVFVTLLGTRWLPKPDGRILFLEDLGERPYRIDRMLTHLRNAGYLDRLAGIVLGQFSNCEPKGPDRWDAMRAAREALAGLSIPILAGLPCGHEHPSFPLPLGTMATLDARRGDLIFEEGFTIPA